MSIYLDFAATTPLLPEVKKVMTDVINDIYGNPSSIHSHGRKSRILIENARKTIAGYLNASIGEIYFTGSATEANNMALIGAVRDLGVQRIISSPIEHHCVLHTLEYLDVNSEARIEFLGVDSKGRISTDELSEALTSSGDKTLVTLMHGNNEIGTLLPIERVADICVQNDALFHCDTAQTMTKYPIDLSQLNIAFVSGAAHKFFGPKGVGFLYIKNDNIIKPLIHGGNQERGMRSGTENIYGIAGMAEAFKLAYNHMEERRSKIEALRQYFIGQLQTSFPDIEFNSCLENDSLYTVLNVSFPFSEKVDLLMMNLDIHGVAVSSGSACGSGAESDSHVLRAIGHPSVRKAIRFSFAHMTTKEELDKVIRILKQII